MGEQLMKYYNYVAKREGLDGKIKLAKATNLPSQKASTAPDSRDNIEMFRAVIADITGESPPRFDAPDRETGVTAGRETQAGTLDDDVPDDVTRTITRVANRLDERYTDRVSDQLSGRSASLEAAFETAVSSRLAELEARLDAAFKTAKHEDEPPTTLARTDVRRYIVAAGLALCALGVLGYVVL